MAMPAPPPGSPLQGRLTGLRLETSSGALRGMFASVPVTAFAHLEAQADGLLHAQELAYWQHLRALRRRQSFLLGRYAAKRALSALAPGTEPSQLHIRTGILGQPVVEGPTSLEVSITHADGVFCALAFPAVHPMGVDVEHLDAHRAEVMRTQCLAGEIAEANALLGDATLAAAVLWTAREALSKALRCGMTCPFELLAVKDLVLDGGLAGGRFQNFGQYRFLSWLGARDVLTLVFPHTTTLHADGPMIDEEPCA